MLYANQYYFVHVQKIKKIRLFGVPVKVTRRNLSNNLYFYSVSDALLKLYKPKDLRRYKRNNKKPQSKNLKKSNHAL